MQQTEPEQDQPEQTYDQPHQAQAQTHQAHDQSHPAHARFWLWYEEKDANESGGQEQTDAPERLRELPKLWREGERCFSQGVKEQCLRVTETTREDS